MRNALVFAFIALVSLLGAKTPNFDLAIIRPQASNDQSFIVRPPEKGRFEAAGNSAKLLLMIAYGVQESQIVGGPGWLSTDKWDIEARTDDGAPHSVEESDQMLQDLLADRFALRIHWETDQRPVYALTVSKNGSKLKPTSHQRENVRLGGKSIIIQRGNVSGMIEALASALGRPVIDRTGLTGLYDYSLQWDDAPNPAGVFAQDDSGAVGDEHGSIFTAVQDQLGLQLKSQRAPVKVIVVDQIEKPSPN